MKTAAVMVTLAAMAVPGILAGAENKREVVVYRTSNSAVPYQIEAAALDQTSKMFGDVGVTLLWRFGKPSRPEAGSIAIEIVTGTPAAFMPGSLAYAFPYEGIHIRILWDRIRDYATPREVLAHVMVHEITHILQGEARHSEEGIMKAHWGPDDLSAMAKKPLSFMALDVDMIYKGIDNRRALAADKSGASDSRKTIAAAAGVVLR